MKPFSSPEIHRIGCLCVSETGRGICVCVKAISGQTIHFVNSFQILYNILPHPSRVRESLSKSKLIAHQREKMQFSSLAFEL